MRSSPAYRCHFFCASSRIVVPVETIAVSATVPQIRILEKPRCNAEEEDCS